MCNGRPSCIVFFFRRFFFFFYESPKISIERDHSLASLGINFMGDSLPLCICAMHVGEIELDIAYAELTSIS